MSQKVESKTYGMLLNTMLSHTVDELSVKQVLALKDPLYIDSRERKEFDVSHIYGAVFVGYDSLDLTEIPKTNLNRPIVVYCSVGYRSEKVAEKLIELGYTKVYNLYGGIFEWVNQGQKVYKKEEQTNQIHAYNKVWGVWLNKGEKVYD